MGEEARAMPLLEVENVTVTFGGVKALNDVSLKVESGQLVGLIGPNGAGKSTMLGVLSGLQPSDKGRVRFEGRDISKAPPYRRSALGMARSFQRLELWGSMTVRENVATAAELASKRSGGSSVRSVTDSVIERFGLGAVAETRASELPTGLARLAEVARAMASRPRIVLLDEPSAGLDDGESKKLTDTLMSIVDEEVSILLVEHHIEMVMRACSHIYVLDFGTLIASGSPSEIRSSDVVQVAYLGSSYATRN
jgi:branched-chain amino acid transport system ATP-binding protein